MINKTGSQGGIPSCAAKTSLPILQDIETKMWTALALPNGGVVIANQDGKLSLVLDGGLFPGITSQIESHVKSLLE